MSYPRKYTGHRISSECLIPESTPDTGSAVNVIPGSIPDTGLAMSILSQEVYRTQDHTVEARMNGGFSYIYMPRPFT